MMNITQPRLFSLFSLLLIYFSGPDKINQLLQNPYKFLSFEWVLFFQWLISFGFVKSTLFKREKKLHMFFFEPQNLPVDREEFTCLNLKSTGKLFEFRRYWKMRVYVFMQHPFRLQGCILFLVFISTERTQKVGVIFNTIGYILLPLRKLHKNAAWRKQLAIRIGDSKWRNLETQAKEFNSSSLHG